MIKTKIFKYLYLHSSVEKYGLNKLIKIVCVLESFFKNSFLKWFTKTFFIHNSSGVQCPHSASHIMKAHNTITMTAQLLESKKRIDAVLTLSNNMDVFKSI